MAKKAAYCVICKKSIKKDQEYVDVHIKKDLTATTHFSCMYDSIASETKKEVVGVLRAEFMKGMGEIKAIMDQMPVYKEKEVVKNG